MEYIQLTCNIKIQLLSGEQSPLKLPKANCDFQIIWQTAQPSVVAILQCPFGLVGRKLDWTPKLVHD